MDTKHLSNKGLLVLSRLSREIKKNSGQIIKITDPNVLGVIDAFMIGVQDTNLLSMHQELKAELNPQSTPEKAVQHQNDINSEVLPPTVQKSYRGTVVEEQQNSPEDAD